VSRTPENWQNGAETEGRMRRAQLIGLAVIVVAIKSVFGEFVFTTSVTARLFIS
jgi:hypothetical protein